MSLYIIVTLTFALPLVLYMPQSEGIHETMHVSLKRRIRSCIGTYMLGMILLLTAAATFNESFEIESRFLPLFALSRQGIFENGFVFQLLTANFLHMDLFHLVTNLSALVLLSAYERRVGWGRFIAVFLVSAVISSIADLPWLGSHEASLGASGGMCGLAAAYFLDYRNLRISDWVKGLLIVTLIIGIFSYLEPIIREASWGKIDHAVHIVGACAGMAYVYFVSPKTVPAIEG